MKIYLASRYQRREEMKGVRDILQNLLGHEVTSRWLDYEDERPEVILIEGAEIGQSAHAVPEMRATICMMDVEDVLAAECVVLNTPSGERGGCNVEWGIAIGAGKRLILVGPEGNVFHHHPQAERYEDVEQFLLSVGAANEHCVE